MGFGRLCRGRGAMNVGILIFAGRLVLGFVFAFASLHKILFPASFAEAIYLYQVMPDVTINAIAITLPWIELVAALLIVGSRSFKKAAALVILGMLVVFTAAITFNILRGLDVACGCFSSKADEVIGWGNVARNLGYMFLAGLVLAEDWVQEKLRPLR